MASKRKKAKAKLPKPVMAWALVLPNGALKVSLYDGSPFLWKAKADALDGSMVGEDPIRVRIVPVRGGSRG